MAKLNPNAQKWVDALRSGKFKQAKGRLKWGKRRCCLGVACELAAADLKIEWDGKYFDNEWQVLPLSVQQWLGVSEGNPDCGFDSLAELNDKGASFGEIASLIVANAEDMGLSA